MTSRGRGELEDQVLPRPRLTVLVPSPLTDVHLTRDGRILLFHDAKLDRTSTGTGLIGSQDWEGEQGIK